MCKPGGAIEAALLQQQPQQRLDAGQQHRLVEIDKAGFQRGTALRSRTMSMALLPLVIVMVALFVPVFHRPIR